MHLHVQLTSFYFVPGKLNVSIVIDFSISVNIIASWFSVSQRLTEINRYQQLVKYYLPDVIYIVCDNNLPQASKLSVKLYHLGILRTNLFRIAMQGV